MKVQSIQDVWATEKAAERVFVPAEVRRVVEKALETRHRGVRLSAVVRARELASGRVSLPTLGRIREFFDAIEKADPDDPEHALHGGDVARAWISSLEKAEPADENDEHEDLRRRLGLLLGAHGDEGVPLEHLAPHVEKHGHKEVARALRDLGADHHQGRVLRKKPEAPKPKAKKKPKPQPAAPPDKPVEKSLPDSTWRPFRFRGLR